MGLPFAMTGRMTDCVHLTYRTPADTVVGLLPEGVELVRRGPWAFWNVMCCRIHKARPTGVPAFCGLSYTHVAYRLMVQAMNDRADTLRGLYFMRSDADTRIVSALGNHLSDFRLHAASIESEASDCRLRYAVSDTPYSQGNLALDLAHAPAQLAPDSCFPTIEDARCFSRHTPDGLAVYEREGGRHLRITQVKRPAQARTETPLVVRHAQVGYFETIEQAEHVRLEWACRLGPMDVRWQVSDGGLLLQQPIKAAKPQRLAV